MSGASPVFQKILVATDFSEHAARALYEALQIARPLGAQVTLVHVLTNVRDAMANMPYEARWDLVRDIDKFEQELRAESNGRLQQLIDQHRDSQVQLSYETLLGTPYVEVIHAVQQEGHDLVVVGTQGLSGLQKYLLGSTAQRLIRFCPAPVWIVPNREVAPLRRILAPVVFSDTCKKVLRIAGELSTSLGAELHVLHVADPALLRQAASNRPLPAEELHQQLLDTVRESLDEFVRESTTSPSPTLHVAEGQAWDQITQAAEQLNVDAVVMGNSARTGLSAFWTGNTAERVLHTCQRPILTIKSDDFRSPIEPPFWPLH